MTDTEQEARAEAERPYVQMTEGERIAYWFARAKAAEAKLEALHPWLMSGEYLSGADLAETIKRIVWDEVDVSPPASPATRESVAEVIRSEGLDDQGASPHGWRCEHPDRFPGYCDCVTEMADALLAAFDIRERRE